MLSKVVSKEEALTKIHDGQTIMFGDWHGEFAADEIIDGMLEKGIKDIHAIAVSAGMPDQGNICMKWHLKEIFLTIDRQFLLAVLNFCADTGRCQAAAKAGAAAADTFGPCTLWAEFDIQFACKHLIAGKWIESNMCCYKRFHAFFTDQGNQSRYSRQSLFPSEFQSYQQHNGFRR